MVGAIFKKAVVKKEHEIHLFKFKFSIQVNLVKKA